MIIQLLNLEKKLYKVILSNRGEAFADTNESQYGYLKQRNLEIVFN